MNWFKKHLGRLGGFINRTQTKAFRFQERSFHQHVRWAEHPGELFKASVRGTEHFAHRSFHYSVVYSPYITAAAAFIVNFIPVVGQIVSLIIVALGTVVNRFAGQLDARYQGMSELESRRYGRKLAKRNLAYGGIAAAVGGLASAAVSVVATSGAEVAAEGGGQAAQATLEGAPNYFSEGGSSALKAADLTETVLTNPSTGGPGTILGSGWNSGGSNIFSQAWAAITEHPIATLGAALGLGGPIATKFLTPRQREQLAQAFDWASLFGGGSGSGGGGAAGDSGPGGLDGWGDEVGGPRPMGLADYLPWALGAVLFVLLLVLVMG